MERAIAVKKLRALLGPKLGYKFDPKAPDKDEREAARAELKEAAKIRDDLAKALDLRRKELCDADPQYQTISDGLKVARARLDKLNAVAYRHRVEVGTTTNLGMFNAFRVAAQGDSWEEVIAEVKRKRAAKELV
jgi:hypothetical protein